MSSLSRLRATLLAAQKDTFRTVTYDSKALDNEVSRLKGWLGARGSDKPPQDLTTHALLRFHRSQTLEGFRHARLVCFGCVDPVLPGKTRLIENRALFLSLLGGVDAYLPSPRRFRLCYRGLLYGYFAYDPDTDTTPESGKANWERLREYLARHAKATTTEGVVPLWVDTLQANLHLLGTNPGSVYGRKLLTEGETAFEQTRTALDIHQSSWLIRRLVLGQIEAASWGEDRAFQADIPQLLELLVRHPLAANAGLVMLLQRYCKCRPAVVHPPLRDFAVNLWGNPWLARNAAKWAAAGEPARRMLAEWLKLVLIEQFFNLLAEDGTNDKRRLQFWQRYHDRIDDMYFALGNTANRNQSADFRDIRHKMAGRMLGLHSAGAPSNNAFIMCIGEFVVVEFGLSGNACFLFQRDNLPFALEGQLAGNQDELKHPNHVERLLHVDKQSESWEQSFEKVLAARVKIRPRSAASLNEASGNSAQSHPPADARMKEGVFGQQLRQFCEREGLEIRDLRDRNGNLWVMTDDSNGFVNHKLRDWDFSYKPGKGWWR